MKLLYTPGTRYSNSEWYDVATTEVVHGWQVFLLHAPDGTPHTRKSFVDNNGILCGIEIAKAKREQAQINAAPAMMSVLYRWHQMAHGATAPTDAEWVAIGVLRDETLRLAMGILP